MMLRPGAPRFFLVTTAILAATHVMLLAFEPNAILLSNLFGISWPLLAASLCMINAHGEGPQTRPLWLLLSSGFGLAATGQVGLTFYELTGHRHTQTQSFNFDFLFFAYGIPVLLAICSREKDVGLKTFAWLDGVQSLIAALLAYLLLFSVLPPYARPKPISALSLMFVYDVEAWILVAALTMRFFSNPTPARRRFYRTLSPYLWMNATVVTSLGYLQLQRGFRNGLQDAAWELPYLGFFAVFALQSSEGNKSLGGGQLRSMKSMELMIDNLSPVLLTLSIVMMGVEIAPDHPRLAALFIAAAVAIYGIRAAILQVRYVQSQEKLTTAVIASEQASLAKSQFLANMSHEIRTPMNGILGMTELALSTQLTEEQREFLLTVKSSADHLLIIINEILDYSKMEAGKTVLSSAAFHLPSVLADALRSLAFLAHQKKLELCLRIAPDLPADIIGDKVRLAQVVINLVGNAIKFTEHGEVCVDISLQRMTYGRAELQFSVRDTGIGIPLNQQEGVFQAFQQAHSSGSRLYGGTGLGLAVCRSLVILMGGTIGLESIPGEGTTVRFSAQFLLVPGWQPAAREPGAEELEGVTALIVDDNATSRSILYEQANTWRVIARTCDSGNAALEEIARAAAAGDPYRLLLLDELMPGTSGFNTLECIRRAPGPQPAVIMMLTSGDRVASADRCRQLGAGGYVIKPIIAAELFTGMRLALGHPRAPGPLHSPANAISASSRSLRILLAEDNLVNQRVAMTMLGKMGHRITLATNGREAVEYWRQNDYDLILMDVQMPEMTGLQATMQIRQEENGLGRHLPIVAMTASAMSEDRDRCLAAGMDNFISKPVSSQAIEQVINATFAEQPLNDHS